MDTIFALKQQIDVVFNNRSEKEREREKDGNRGGERKRGTQFEEKNKENKKVLQAGLSASILTLVLVFHL